MPDQSSDSPLSSGAAASGDHAVMVGGDNYSTINTGVIINIHGDVIEKNVEIARTILAASLLAPPLDAQRKADIVDYYRSIAQTLSDAAQALRQGDIPHGKCGEMLGYAQMLVATIGDVIGRDQAAALSGKLMESYQVEAFGHQFMHLPPAERDARFGELDEAAGYFRAAAASLRLRR
jgi:hypothetical protein